MEFFGADEHYINAAQAMIDLDKQKEEFAKARDVSNKVNTLGFGDTIRKKVAEYADVRDDVRQSEAIKRKRKDANDIRRHLVHSYVPEDAHPLHPFGNGFTWIEIGSHTPAFMDDSDKRYFGDNISELKLKKKKHSLRDSGFRGY